MNLEEKVRELVLVLSGFLNGSVQVDKLQTFVWEVIEYFTSTPKDALPPLADFENVFWYAIWQIQHLATDDHVADGTACRELAEVLEYLQGQKELPKDYFGRRP